MNANILPNLTEGSRGINKKLELIVEVNKKLQQELFSFAYSKNDADLQANKTY